VHDLVGAVEREEQRARVEVLGLVQRQLDRGDHAAGGQLGERADPGVLAVGRHDLGPEHAVAGDAVAAGQPAHAVAHHVADHAGAAGEAGGGSEAGQRGAVDHVGPTGAGPDACAVRLDVDLDAAEGGRAQQHGVAERAGRGRSMTLRLGDDAQAALGGDADGGRHVAVVDRQRDHRGLLIDGEVERAARGIPAQVIGLEERDG
jgi:hypothetical protein